MMRTLTQRLRDLSERFRCDYTGGDTAPDLKQAADVIDTLRAENQKLALQVQRLDHALTRTRNVLGNMALEHTSGWRSVIARWPIHHEPLRSDARGLLPIVEAALEGRDSPL